MPAYDQVVRITEPGGQALQRIDWGWRNQGWYGTQNDIVSAPGETRSYSVRRALHGGVANDYVNVSEVERDRFTTVDRFEVARLGAGGDYRCSWGEGGSRWYGPVLTEIQDMRGMVLGAPGDTTNADAVTALDAAVPSTLTDVTGELVAVLRNYDDEDDPTIIATMAVFGIAQWRKIGSGIYQLVFAENAIRQLNVGSNLYEQWGLIVDLINTDTTFEHRYWARQLDSDQVLTTINLEGTAQDSVTLSRTYEVRWSDRIRPYSDLTDKDGDTWQVTGLTERGRRRYLEIECERTVRRFDL